MGTNNRGYLAKKMIQYTVVLLGGKVTTLNCPVGSDALRTLIRSGGVVSYTKGAIK